MSKRWGVWSRLFIVLGVLWTVGFPVVAWLAARKDALDRYSTMLKLCYDYANNGAADLDRCLAEQRFAGPGADYFLGMAGIAAGLMTISIILFLIARAVVRWILAGRNRAV